MAVGNFTLYTSGKEALLADNAGSISWASDTIVCALVSNGYTPNVAHTVWSDVSTNHASGTNYSPVVLSGKTSALNSTKILWDCADIAFGSEVTVTAKYAVILKRAGGSLAGSDQLIGYVDLNNDSGSATVSSTASTFTITTAAGLFDV